MARKSAAASGEAIRLVGRHDEMAFFDARLDDALRKDGSTTLVYGEPGIGKTHLVAAWAAAARARGFRVANATCLRFAREPFGPLAEACRGLIRAEPRAQPKAPVERALLRRFADLTTDATAAGEVWQKRRLLVIVREFLERLTSYVPLFLSVDDAQWSDPESIELLQYLAPHVTGMRALLVIAARTEAEKDGPLASASANLSGAPGAYRIALSPLNMLQTLELVDAELGARSLSRARREAICRNSEGNPLFAEDLLRRALSSDDGSLPASIEQSVRERLAHLTPACATFLEAAAIAGGHLDLTMLAECSNVAPEAANGFVRAARAVGIIVEPDDGDGPRFRHELVRQAIADRLTAAERRRFHEDFARWLEGREEQRSPAALHRHWLGAGDRPRAAAYAEAAGDAAAAQFAFASARDHYETALASESLNPAAITRLSEKLGNAHDVLGDAAAAYECLSKAASSQSEGGSGAVAAALSLRLAHVAYRLAKNDETMLHCEAALAAAEPDSSERFAAHVLLATHWSYRGELTEAVSQLALAESTTGARDPAFVVRLHIARATIAMKSADVTTWRSASAAAIETAERYGDPAMLANCLAHFADAARFRGEVDAAETAFNRAITVADAYALGYSSVYSRVASADMAYLCGDTPRAHELIRAACALNAEGAFLRFFAASVGMSIALAAGDKLLAERLSNRELFEEIAAHSGLSPES